MAASDVGIVEQRSVLYGWQMIGWRWIGRQETVVGYCKVLSKCGVIDDEISAHRIVCLTANCFVWVAGGRMIVTKHGTYGIS